jgi:hypothetical protein
MKRFMTILVLAMLVMAPMAMAQPQYGWTVSSSLADPFVNSGVPTGGIATLYLWLQCTSPGDGVAAAEFDMQGPAGAVLAFTAMNGFLNAGGVTNLLLATACTSGPIVAGNWLCLSLPGNFCLRPSAANAKNVSVDCVNFQEWPNGTIGFANGVAQICADVLCPPISVETRSWGQIKGLYQ